MVIESIPKSRILWLFDKKCNRQWEVWWISWISSRIMVALKWGNMIDIQRRRGGSMFVINASLLWIGRWQIRKRESEEDRIIINSIATRMKVGNRQNMQSIEPLPKKYTHNTPFVGNNTLRSCPRLFWNHSYSVQSEALFNTFYSLWELETIAFCHPW